MSFIRIYDAKRESDGPVRKPLNSDEGHARKALCIPCLNVVGLRVYESGARTVPRGGWCRLCLYSSACRNAQTCVQQPNVTIFIYDALMHANSC